MSHVTWKCSRHLDTYVWNVLYFVNVALHRGEGEIRRRTRVSGECWVQSEVDLNPNAPTQSGCLERITNQATKQFICEFMLHKLQKQMYSYYYTNIHICKQQQQYGDDNVVVWTSSIDVSNTESSSPVLVVSVGTTVPDFKLFDQRESHFVRFLYKRQDNNQEQL